MGQNLPAGPSGGRQDRVPLGFGDLYASPGDHIGHFYQTSEQGQRVLVAFLQHGLESNQKVVCLIRAGRDHQKLEEALAAAGVDVVSAVASGQLIIDAGKGDPKELQDMLSRTLAEIPERFPLLRWAGVMSWALEKTPTTEKLMEWESHCNTVEKPTAIFLCQYELTAFLGTVVMDALKTHPVCIVSNVVHQNPYYEDPKAYLEELRRRKSTPLA